MLTERSVRSAIASVIDRIDASSIDAAADFYDCDLDSLDHANIILRLEELYDLRVGDDDFDRCRSIEAIIDYFRPLGSA